MFRIFRFSITIIFTISILASQYGGYSSSNWCGTKDDYNIAADRYPENLSQWRNISRTEINIPVAFHVIHDDDVGFIPQEVINEQIDVLNNNYAFHNIIFTLTTIDYTDNYYWFLDAACTIEDYDNQEECEENSGTWVIFEDNFKEALAVDPAPQKG